MSSQPWVPSVASWCHCRARGGTCLISVAELSRLRGMGLVAGVLRGSEAPENLGLKITVGDSR